MVAPLLFAIELAVLYVAGSNMMSHLMGISGFDGVLGRIVFYLLVWFFTRALTFWRACSLEPRSPASHHSRQVEERRMVASCWAMSVISAAPYL